MNLHLLITVFALMVYENTSTVNPQLASPYQLAFSPYYQPSGHSSYYHPDPHQEQTAISSYSKHYLAPYRYQQQNYFGLDEESADYKEGNHPFSYMFSRVCPTVPTLFPCTCQRQKNTNGMLLLAEYYGTISCPEGQTAATIQQILGQVSAGFNIKTVNLQLNRGSNILNSVPLAFTSNYPTATINIVYPTDPNKCIDSTLLSPCTCSLSRTTCPSGTSIGQIQATYSKIASNTNLGSVVLNFPASSYTKIPNDLLGTNAATSIELIGPVATKKALLMVAPGAFTSSAPSVTQFKMSNFDLANINYGFFANFNVLTTIEINNCDNAPTVVNQPNLPKNLPKLQAVYINGVNIYTPNGR